MLSKRVYLVRCPGCQDPIVLPHQSRLEISGGLPRRAKDIWPLNFWCEGCALLSVHQELDARLEGVEVQARSPYTEILWEIEFECGREGYKKRFFLYTKHLAKPLEHGGAMRVIAFSGLSKNLDEVKILSTIYYEPD
jgi:hypothetical protein